MPRPRLTAVLIIFGLMVALVGHAHAAEDPRLKVGEPIQYPFGRSWKEAVIRQVDGDLVLVQTKPNLDKPFFWEWRALDQLKLPGDDKPDPDPFASRDIIKVGVGSGSVEEARQKAVQELVELQRAEDPSVEVVGEDAADVPMLDTSSAGWTYQASPPTKPSPKLRGAALTRADLGSITSFGVVGTEQPIAVVGRVVGIGAEADAVGVEMVDLRSGQSKLLELPTDLRVIAGADEGRRIAARSHAFGFGKSNRLEIHDVDVKAETTSVVATAYPFGRDGIESDIASATFLDVGDRVLVRSARDRLMVLDAATLSNGWQTTLPMMTTIAVRSDGTMLAMPSDDAILLVDVSGTVVGELGDGVGRISAMTFNADGSRLAASTDGVLYVWNLQDGGTPMLTTGIAQTAGRTMQFVEDLLLVGDRLIDPQTGGQIWRYTDVPDETVVVADTLVGLDRPNAIDAGAVRPLEVPHPAALAAADQLATRDLFANGATVKLDVRGLPGPWKAKATEHLTAQLETLGLTIDPAADVSLVASTIRGDASEAEFGDLHRNPFRDGPTESVNSQDLTHTLTLVGPAGEPAFATSSFWRMPSIVRKEQGQSANAAVAAQADDSYGFYTQVQLPPAVVTTTSAIGESPM